MKSGQIINRPPLERQLTIYTLTLKLFLIVLNVCRNRINAVYNFRWKVFSIWITD